MFGPQDSSGENQYVINGPTFLGMQACTAYSVARRWPVEESGYHVNARSDVP